MRVLIGEEVEFFRFFSDWMQRLFILLFILRSFFVEILLRFLKVFIVVLMVLIVSLKFFLMSLFFFVFIIFVVFFIFMVQCEILQRLQEIFIEFWMKCRLLVIGEYFMRSLVVILRILFLRRWSLFDIFFVELNFFLRFFLVFFRELRVLFFILFISFLSCFLLILRSFFMVLFYMIYSMGVFLSFLEFKR